MNETALLVIEIIGIIAFAASGAMVGLTKKMDLFGVIILGICTAVGGGVIRDITLGITPPGVFGKPLLVLVAASVSVILFLPVVRRVFIRHEKLYDMMLLLMDSVGLGLFTVVGVRTAYIAMSGEAGMLLVIFVGSISGTGGSILRDVMAGNVPFIFTKHFYACASIIGAVVCGLMWKPLGETAAMMTGFALVLAIRLLAARYHWSLPKAEPLEDENGPDARK